MKNTAKLLIISMLLISMCIGLISCANKKEGEKIKTATLNGTTGFGMAQLINEHSDKYDTRVESDASVITASLISGDIDIATLPTNAAANLYQKTEGGIKILAVNTLGVLYVVTNEENSDIKSLSDLEGKTVYCPAQNPTFIFKGLCSKAGVNVTVDSSYAQPADLRQALVSGAVGIAVLPEPMVTIAKSKNSSLSVSVDLTAEWNKHFPENSLMQGCVVARSEFIESDPEAVEEFLFHYETSVNFVNQSPKEASALIASAKIFENAAVAEKAIPKCNIKYIDGDEMSAALDIFFSTLYEINPQSVGGKTPDANIYYKAND